MTQNSTRSSHQQTYTASRLGWNGCLTYLDNFKKFSDVYTPAYIDEQLAKIDETEALPDEQNRGEISETARILLADKAEEGRFSWQCLKRYIIRHFEESLHVSKLDAAGASHYEKASGRNWEANRNLLNSGSNFIKDHKAEMIASKVMPAAFPDEFEVVRKACQDSYNAYLNANIETEKLTAAKVQATNEIYKNTINMCLDGQLIFSKNPDRKREFIYEQILEKAGRNTLAGLKGTAVDSVTGQPLADVAIITTNNMYSTETGKDGAFRLKAMAAGKYTFQFFKEGYDLVSMEVVIKTGVTSSLSIPMTATAEQPVTTV